MTILRAALVSTTLLAFVVPAGGPVKAGEDVGDLVGRAGVAFRSGHQREAWELYNRAARIAPASPEAARGICRVALALSREEVAAGKEEAAGKQAGEACQRALILGRSPEDMSNRVAAWVGGPIPPAMEDLVSASFMADGAVRLAATEPWGYLAQGDLALRLGDRDLLDASISELLRVAPGHEATRRFLAHATPPAPAWIWVGRILIALALILTAAHVIAKRRARARAWTRTALAIATMVILTAPAARAELGAPPPPAIDDAHPEASIQQVEKGGNPLAVGDLLMELADRGEKATKRGDHAAAARYWTAATKAVPGRAYGWARLCDSLDAAGRRDEAIVACRRALVSQGATVGDITHFVHLLLSTNAPLTKSERKEVDVAIGQVAKEPQAALETESLRCKVAAHEHEIPGLRACSAKLAAAAPNELRSIWAQWALAVETNDRAKARELVDRVRATGRNGKIAGAMEETMAGLPAPPVSKVARAARWGAGGAIAFLGSLLLYAGIARALSTWRRRRDNASRRGSVIRV